MDSQLYCRKICQESGSNFVATFKLMSALRRRAFEAFYAFCRLADDAVDEAVSSEAAEAALARWQDEVKQIYYGTPLHPVGKALAPVVHHYQIPEEYLHEILAGCAMDLKPAPYPTMEALEQYCYRVASCVGLVCLHLLGVPLTEQTRAAAISLGKAVQLTNILRDLKEDLAQGRCYIPEEDQRRFGLGNELIHFEVKRAEAYYHEAWRKFPRRGWERRKLMAAIAMGRIYETLLGKIKRNPETVFQRRVSLSLGKKLFLAATTAAQMILVPWSFKKSLKASPAPSI